MEGHGTEWEGETVLDLDYWDDLSVLGKRLVKWRNLWRFLESRVQKKIKKNTIESWSFMCLFYLIS